MREVAASEILNVVSQPDPPTMASQPDPPTMASQPNRTSTLEPYIPLL